MRTRQGHRGVRTEQRYGENLDEVVASLDLLTGTIIPGGQIQAVQLDAYKDKVLVEVGDEELTEPDIKERVKGNATTTSKALRALFGSGSLRRAGAGKKGDPYLYSKSDLVGSSILDLPPMGNRENQVSAF